MAIDYRDLFLTDKDLTDHVEAYNIDLERYMTTFMLLQNSDVHIAWEVKEKFFGTLLIFKNEAAIKFLFTKPFWTILDIRNVIRLLWTKSRNDENLRKLMANGHNIQKSRRAILKDRITEMTPQKIERSILRHSYDAWREVIDFLHIAERDFPDFVYHDAMLADKELFNHSPLVKTIMDGSWEPTPFIKMMRSINQKNATQILMHYPTEFHYLRSKINFEKNPEIARAYLQLCDPKNIIRWFSDLWWPSTRSTISERIRCFPKDQMIHHPYSRYFNVLYENRNVMDEELYEELLRRADEMTGRFTLPILGPALIAVDQSSSMSEEQVKIGTVIASQCGAQLDADLCYFYGSGWSGDNAIAEYESIPLGTHASLLMIDKHQPTGNTPVAQVMGKYLYSQSPATKKLKSVVLVTDEGENSSWKRMDFTAALDAYRQLVGYNLEVLIIAIQSDNLTISHRLKAHNFNVLRYRCDKLENIESLFALIEANTVLCQINLNQASKKLKTALYASTGSLPAGHPENTAVYIELDKEMYRYKKQRDNIFASVIKGTCVNCGAPLSVEQVTEFRFGGTIECPACDFTMSPTLFGGSHVL